MKIQSLKILNKRAFIVQIVILILALLGTVWGYSFLNTNSITSNKKVVLEQKLAEKAVDGYLYQPIKVEQVGLLTKNWKSYISEKAGFEIKYPSTWSMSESAFYDVNREAWEFCPPALTEKTGVCTRKDTYGHMPDTRAPIVFSQRPISESDSKNPAHKLLGKKDGSEYYLILINPLFKKEFDVIASTFTFTSAKIVPSPTILPSTNSSPRIEPLALPNSPVTSYYTQNLEVFGFSTSTIQWQIISGSLPPGLHLQNQYVSCVGIGECLIPDIIKFRAMISGKPTKAGNYNFTVKASNGTQSATKNYSLNLY